MKQRLRVVILQETITHYRVPFFEGLGEYFDLTILHCDPRVTNEFEKFKTHYLPVNKLGPIIFQRQLWRYLRMNRFDRIVFMFDIHWVASLFACLLLPRSSYALWGHRYSKSTLGNSIKNFFLRRANRIILYSDCHRAELNRLGIEDRRVFTAHNTMAVSNHCDLSRETKDSFLFVGRLQPRKRLDLLLRAFAKAIGPNDGVKLNIVGDGDEKRMLLDLASELNVNDRVFFHGEVLDEAALSKLYSTAIAYVSPGPVGLSVLQSFSYGVPVITCKLGKHGPEFSNLVDKTNALVYEDQSDLCATLNYAKQNRESMAKLGSSAFVHYRDHRSVSTMIESFVNALS